MGVRVMVDLGAIRKTLGEQVAAALPGVNVYAWPEPQPEYPSVVFGPLDVIEYHVSYCVEGVALTWLVDVFVANPDQESAARNLEALLSGDTANVVLAIESATPSAGEWSSLVIAEARNFRRLESLDGFGCELVLTVHV
jgi:hypothetical protein